jgi:GT2 family glycosyltransferase
VGSLTLAICTLDRPEELARCLTSIAAQTRLPEEILVVDASREPVRHPTTELDLLVLPAKANLAFQRNVAVDAASSDVIVFVDDDCELEADYLRALGGAFDDGDVVAATGRFLELAARDTLFRRTARAFFCLPGPGTGRFRPSTFATYAVDDEERDVQCLPGGNMAVRREVARRVRFDEDAAFGYAGFEDDDLSRRVRFDGRIRYVPTARLWHRQPDDGRDQTRFYAAVVTNAWYLRRKNWPRSILTDIAFGWALVGFLAQHAARGRGAELRGVLRGVVALLRSGGARAPAVSPAEAMSRTLDGAPADPEAEVEVDGGVGRPHR